MKTVNDIRSEFLGFFEKQGHTRVASSPLVPQNDPTLMFTNSGMVQFKNVFTGQESRPYSRATTAQKSVRAGGKHNDLDNVGYTARHHTFFEMLGNFSFGDYFKEDAIAFAWELVSKNFGMPKDKLLVTVHTSDEEAADIWKKVAGFPDSRIIRIPTNDNFWMMGDTGPCGPCSEIFFDQGDKLQGGPPGSPDEDGDRFLEFWNLVFMQYEQFNDGRERIKLPKPSVDTGMGLERMAALMQGKTSNYDIDLLRSIIEHSADLTGVSPDGEHAASHRVISDHLRCASFLLADGVMPSNEGRGYVLRRIMRRGMRHAHILGAQEPLMYKLFPTLLGKMGEAYPELKRAEALITETLKMEETRFKKTLDRGLKMLDDEAERVNNNVLPGDVAFKLYDTYGFPVDLTADALRAKGIEVDMNGFNKAMEDQKATARKSWTGSGDVGTQKIWFDILDQNGATEFLGYERDSSEGKILAIVKDGALVDKLKAGEEGQIIVNQTPFYGESGGQVGDTGVFLTDAGDSFTVTDTKKMLGKLFVHIGTVSKGELEVGEGVECRVDAQRRAAIKANHSVTHLLHEALRRVLGDHVAQKGSLQEETRTRFDISQPIAITPEQLRAVEQQVNDEIRANTDIVTRVLALDEAMESGARALFGEKYDDEVRVVSMGTKKNGENHVYSVELCGGTHASRTGDIGQFKIISESAVSAGVRRIEALTGERVDEYLAAQSQEQSSRIQKHKEDIEKLRQDFTALGGKDALKLVDDEEALIAHKKMLQKQISDLRLANATQSASTDEAKDIGNVKFLSKILPGFPAKDLKPMADDLKQKVGSGVVVLISTEEDKASIVVAVTSDLTDRISAVDLVKIGAEALGGKGGGGRPDMAQAGGPNAAAANDAVSAMEKRLTA